MRCADFYKKWEQEPNWCEKTPGAVSQINSYLELVKEIAAKGLEKDLIYEKFPERAARVIKEDDGRADLLNYVIACLKRDERITAGDLKKFTMVKAAPSLPVEKERVPPAPIAPILKEKYPPQVHHPITDTTGQVSPITDIPWHCGTVPCPDGEDHTGVDKIRGKICDLLGLPCNQLEKKRCPALNGQVPESGFTTTAEYDPVTGGRLIKSPPIKITRAPIIIQFSPSAKQQEFIEQVIKSGEFESPVEFLSALVDRAMEVS